VSVAASNATDAPLFSSQRLVAISRRLEQDVASSAIPGATIIIGSRDQVLFERSVGFRDVMTQDPLQLDAIWRIYSMTKPLVTAAAMTFVEQGLLRLDQAVDDFIPAFGKLRVMDGERSTVSVTNPPTIQDLMRHTAGLAYGYLGDSPAQRAYAADGFLKEDLSNADFADRLAALPLEYQPGTVWHYSHATDVLGRVLEIIRGADLQAILQETLLGPLDMPETVFRLACAERHRVAEPLPGSRGMPPYFLDPCRPRRGQRGGGGLVSTARDYARFLRMLLGKGTLDGRRVLSPATVELMTADHLGTSIGRASYYPPGPGYGFGLGFAVRRSQGEAPFPGSCGDYFWSGVGGTYFWVDPAYGLFALFLLQSSSPEQRRHYRTLIRGMVYAAVD
jgi:CubicO group peptidase (beta-lactamase class C family)